MSDVKKPMVTATPTTTGVDSGVENGLAWTFEAAGEHWRLHDVRERAYWQTRTPEERLAQAAWYRARVHGDEIAHGPWTWRFLGEPDADV